MCWAVTPSTIYRPRELYSRSCKQWTAMAKVIHRAHMLNIYMLNIYMLNTHAVQCVTNTIFRPEYEYKYIWVDIFWQLRI